MKTYPGICYILGCILSIAAPLEASRKGSEAASLHCVLAPVAGKRFHHGPSDCTAEATITVDTGAIHVNVSVTVPDPNSTLGQQDIVVFSREQSLAVEQYVDAFTLPSGKPALLIGKYEYTMGGCFASGMCGCNVEASLVLVTDLETHREASFGLRDEDENELQIAHWSGCQNAIGFGDSLSFSDPDMDISFSDSIGTPETTGAGKPFDWNSILDVLPQEHRLTMHLGNGIVVGADWDETNSTITYKLQGAPVRRSSEE